MAFNYVHIQLQTKFILEIIKIDSSFNIIRKVVPGVTTWFKKYFYLDCKFADGLNSLKSLSISVPTSSLRG